jgi:formylglycine-generating enzyme required for sulfatase activity
MPANRYRKSLDTAGAEQLADNFPVTGVTHAGVACYIKWINTKSEARFRLPTPSEWLAAARRAAPAPAGWDAIAMSRSASAHSDDPREAVNRGYVRPVGLGTPTQEGVFDLEGNAAELTSSWRSRPRDEVCASGDVPCQSRLALGLGSSDKPELYREAVWAMDGVPYSMIGFRLAAD